MKETGFNTTKTCGVSRLPKPSTLGRMLFAIALAVITRQEACGSGAYLPRVGPPGLRFEPVPVPNQAVAKIFTPEVVKDSKVVAPAIEPTPNMTNATSVVASSVDAAINSGDVSSPVISLPSATDNSVVTSQMLVDFLKPTAHGAVFVPINVRFTPPTQNVVEPSRAVYKSQ
jgi:hypothetical protein